MLSGGILLIQQVFGVGNTNRPQAFTYKQDFINWCAVSAGCRAGIVKTQSVTSLANFVTVRQYRIAGNKKDACFASVICVLFGFVFIMVLIILVMTK